MEFEKDAPVSDAQRLLAQTKKLTLQPLHTDVEPDAIQGPEHAASNIIEPAIGNASSETENNTLRILPTKSLLDAQSQKTRAPKLIFGLYAGMALFAGLAILALLK
ncbi:MAG TPA: hypothetical protein VGO98_02065 [Candidatus Saccharimonadales bacterium]|jgi:hypothetical protein|nr:hypothetical protein [Candidatus Saccharimonadales bacterium]